MPKVDLGRLEHEGRVELAEQIPVDSELWQEAGIRLTRPMDVRLLVQKAGKDVVVRGRLEGEVLTSCRRCLMDVVVDVAEDVAWLYRPGIEAYDAEREEVYPLLDRRRELDLSDAVREHALLAVPAYAVCQEACRGLCPKCGTNLNEATCACQSEEVDDRWAALRRLKHE